MKPDSGPSPTDLQQLLEQQIQEGVPHSTGRFTQSLDKQNIKLAEYQLQPGEFILKWVQAASILHCQEIRILFDVPLEFTMVGLDLEQVPLESLAASLASPFNLPPESVLANLVFGLLASQQKISPDPTPVAPNPFQTDLFQISPVRPSPIRTVWETSQGQFLELNNRQVNFYTRPTSPATKPWAKITLSGLSTANLVARRFYDSCAYCPVPVFAYGNYIGSPWEFCMSDSLGLQYRLAERFIDQQNLGPDRKIALSASSPSLCHRIDRLSPRPSASAPPLEVESPVRLAPPIINGSSSRGAALPPSPGSAPESEEPNSLPSATAMQSYTPGTDTYLEKYKPQVVSLSRLELAEAAMALSEQWTGSDITLLWHRHGVIVDRFTVNWKTGRLREYNNSGEPQTATILWPAYGLPSDISQLRLQRNARLAQHTLQALQHFRLMLETLWQQSQDFKIPVRSGVLEVAVGGGLGGVALAALGAFIVPAAAPTLMVGTLGCILAAGGYYRFSAKNTDSRRSQEVKTLLQTLQQQPPLCQVFLPNDGTGL